VKEGSKENIFLECNWDEDDEEIEEVGSSERIDNLAEMYKDNKTKHKNKGQNRQRSSFLLALSSDEES
jgi:hypothetical protein